MACHWKKEKRATVLHVNVCIQAYLLKMIDFAYLFFLRAYGVSSGCVIAGLIDLGYDVLEGTSLKILDKSPTSLYTEFQSLEGKKRIPKLRPWVETGKPYPSEPQVDEVEITLGEAVDFNFYESARTDLAKGDIKLADWDKNDKKLVGVKSPCALYYIAEFG